MTRVVCPGSFDPVTEGHLDIIGRAATLFDEVIVGVGKNVGKRALFTAEERIAMIRKVTGEYPNVRVEAMDGLLVDFCVQHGARAMVKGLRAVSDYEYELTMSQMNHRLSGVETLFVASDPEYSYLSSSLIKEVAALGGDVSGLVPDHVLAQLTTRLAERKAKSD
ncbi:pantetheine-phosphate adenylyltransferase [Nocardia aurantiaca]|uniref:Phosphopantetheine adenylyltransferase n=1 Tax=Nocardia aurantiaca TaxID=2675850 RepID=A0A6I3KUX7_9NOCA|nr:pantetheine-phosphate adenylyltransferase [Nocardia aurantiaca]MTE13347.1 pantetheine-phosphate adenylyltransferase [Nocardia aurantiaca]